MLFRRRQLFRRRHLNSNRYLTFVRASLSASRPLSASAGTLAKASLVGANTVKGPAPDRVSAKPMAKIINKKCRASSSFSTAWGEGERGGGITEFAWFDRIGRYW